jgi:protein-disulfide isomerase
MPHNKKFYILLLAMVVLAGFFFYRQIMRTGQITVSRAKSPLISANTIFIPNSESDQTIGNPGAALTIVEFMDVGCTRCLLLHATIKDFVTKHPQDIRLIWKDDVKPRIFSDYTLAHQAAFCAGLPGEALAKSGGQNKFWEFMDIAIANRNNLLEPGLKKIAQDLNLDVEPWWQCVNSAETKQAIANSIQLADQLGIKSLPAIFVNNKLINTGKDINIKEMLENFIKK